MQDPISLVSDTPLPESSVAEPGSADPKSEAVASPAAVASSSIPALHLPSVSLCAVGWWGGVEVAVCGRGSSWMGGSTWVRTIVTGWGADDESSADLLLLPWWPLWRRLVRGTS